MVGDLEKNRLGHDIFERPFLFVIEVIYFFPYFNKHNQTNKPKMDIVQHKNIERDIQTYHPTEHIYTVK